MMMSTTHNRSGVIHSTQLSRGMQGHRWQIMTALLRWHDNQVLLHLVMAAQYQLLHVGWQHYDHYLPLTVMSRYAFVSCECFTITSRLWICFILDCVPSAISLHSQLTREGKREREREKKKRKSKSAKTTSSGRPAKRAFVSSLRNCQVYPTSFCSYSCFTMDALHHYICSDISFDLICQLLHWAPWYSPSPLARGIRLINQAGLFFWSARLPLLVTKGESLTSEE